MYGNYNSICSFNVLYNLDCPPEPGRKFDRVKSLSFSEDYVQIFSGSYSEKIPLTYIDEAHKSIKNEELKFKFPGALNEHIEFNVQVQQSSYIIQNHTLKQISVLDGNTLIDSKYFLGDKISFHNGLEYGNYKIELKIGEQSRVSKLKISLPWNRNPFFFGALSVFMFLLFGLLVKMFLDKNRLKEKTLENRMLVLNQNFNPHFVYNTMNLISSLVLEEKNEDALQVISEFSKLQRTFLETNNQEVISLGSELKFIEAYLKLQKRRFVSDNDFEYTISVSDPVVLNKIKLPPFILQPLVENAIKYGIIGSDAERKWIKVEVKGDGPLVIAVEDNGENVDKEREGFGLGLKIVLERAKLFNTTNKSKITIHFTTPVHSTQGYRVELHLT